MNEKIKVRNKNIFIAVIVISLVSIVLAFFTNSLGRELSTTKIVEFTSTGQNVTGVFETVDQIERNAEVQALEDLEYRAYFSDDQSDEYLKEQFSEKLNIQIEDGDINYSEGLNANFSSGKYLIILGLVIVVFIFSALFVWKGFRRVFRLKASLTLFLESLFITLTVAGFIFLLSVLGVYKISLWSISFIELVAVTSIIINMFSMRKLFIDEFSYKSTKHNEIFREFADRRIKSFNWIGMGLVILLASIFIVTATPYAYGVIVSIVIGSIFYYSFHFAVYEIFTVVADIIDRVDYFKNNKFWQS